MQRRDFIKLLMSSSLISPSLLNAGEAFTPYTGELFIVVHANGGWDISSFCDPKADPLINNWAKTQSIVNTTSQIKYAPFAKNANFFETHHQDMLVLNGIDTQTNAHNAGVRHMFSGRFDEGYPAFGALYASIKAPNLPLSYISNGAYNYTASLSNFTLMQNPTSLGNLIDTNAAPYGSAGFHHSAQNDIIKKYSAARLARAQVNTKLSPRLKKAVDSFAQASQSKEELSLLKNYLPSAENLVPIVDANDNYNPLPRQAQLTLVAMKAGLCSTADLRLDGFDTHDNHDIEHGLALSNLSDGLNFLWTEAERLGISDRLTVFVTSDFSRTPSYNDGKGKDHWPSSSAIFIKKNASWGGKVFGATDDNLGALAVDQNIVPSAGGIIIEPRHVQSALRSLAGIDQHAYSQKFNLDNSDLDLKNIFL